MSNYRGKFVSIEYDNSSNILINTWYKETAAMTDEQYKSEMLEYARMVEKFRPNGLLMDTLNFNFVQSVEMQSWMAENVIAKDIENGMKKYAILLPEGIFEQISLEQTVEGSAEARIKMEYFKDRDAAYRWLME